MPTYRIHPLCEKFPDMPEDEFKALVEDMRTHGQREPAWVFGKTLLDGKHRLRACEFLGIKLDVREWRPKHGPEEPQIKAFVLSRNFYRRHLSPSQRSLLAAELVTTAGPGQPKSIAQICAISQEEAAAAAGVSRRSVQLAGDVLESGSAALQEAVRDGDINVSDAARVLDLPKSEQTAAVKAVAAGEASTVAAAAGVKPRKPRKPRSAPHKSNGEAQREAGEDRTEVEHDETIRDAFGAVPRRLRKVFAELSNFRGIVNRIGKLKSDIEDLQHSDAGASIPLQPVLKYLAETQRAIKLAEPHCECPKCRGKAKDDCNACKGLGWITEMTWNRCRTKEDEQWLTNRG